MSDGDQRAASGRIGAGDARALLQIHAAPADADLAAPLADLFRSVGYVVEPRGEATGGAVATAHHIVIAGKVAPELVASGDDTAGMVVIVRPNGVLPAPLRRTRARVVEERGDVYQVFERVALGLGLVTRTDVFLSYARADAAAADGLLTRLAEHGRRVWVDRRELHPSDEWLAMLRQGVEASDSFLILVSRASLASTYCRQELEWAVDLGKRIIPVMLAAIPPSGLPPALASRQYIAPPAGVIDAATSEQIVAALDRDPRAVQLHAQILRRALQWTERGQDASLLLRGSELNEAEQWLATATADREPRPVPMQSALIGASAAARRARQRTMWLIGVGVGVTLIALTIWAIVNAFQANSRLAQQQGFGAVVDWDRDPVKAYLHADAALRTAPFRDRLAPAYAAMTHNLVTQMPESVTNLESGSSVAAFDRALSRIVFKPPNLDPVIVPLTGRPGRRVELVGSIALPNYRQFTFSPDGTLLAAVVQPFMETSAPHTVEVWRADSGDRVGAARIADSFGSDIPSIVGFTADNRALVLDSRSGESHRARVFSVANLTQGELPATWTSRWAFLRGQVDASLSSLVQVEAGGDGGDYGVAVLDPVSGAPRWPRLTFDAPVRQAWLASGGQALAVVTQRAGGPSQLTVWVRTADGAARVGETMSSPGTILLWDVAPDGDAVLVEDAAADYPAEVWEMRSGSRGTLPLDPRRTDYIMKTGDEFMVLSFAADARFVVARAALDDPLQGGQRQRLLLFDRATLQLAAVPFDLTLDYASLRPAATGTRFARVSHDGLVEEWDLLRRRLPTPHRLGLTDVVLDAAFLPATQQVMTVARAGEGGRYRAQIDFWDMATGSARGRLPHEFEIRTSFALNADQTRLATATRDDTTCRVQLWDVHARQEIWTQPCAGPVETIAFRHDERLVSTAGSFDDGAALVVDHDATTGMPASPGTRPALERGSVHLAFSRDGDALIADYDYASVAIWDLRANTRLVDDYSFSGATGLGFDLAYDILLDVGRLRADRSANLRGLLSGRVPVEFRREGHGTAIVPIGDDTPVLSAVNRADRSLYPLRGTSMLSASGRWFILATNQTAVPRSSALRVFDVGSGYPVSDFLVHQALARPGTPLAQRLSRGEVDLDPVQTAAYLEDEGAVMTLTTDGWLRVWRFAPGTHDVDLATTSPDLPAALTGRRLGRNGYTRRVPQSEFAALRVDLAAELAAIRPAQDQRR